MGFLSFVSDMLDAYDGTDTILVESVGDLTIGIYRDDVCISVSDTPFSFCHEYKYNPKIENYTMAKFREKLLEDFRNAHHLLFKVTEDDIYVPEKENVLCLCPDLYDSDGKTSILVKFKMKRNGKEMTYSDIRNFWPKYYNSPFGYGAWTNVEITDIPKHSSFYDDEE